jgi:hypothetical protein
MSVKYARKVIRIKAEDSPNVVLALRQKALGMKPTGAQIIPGCLDWDLYCHRRKTWDAVRQCISLDGMFYEGADQLLFPPDHLNRAEQWAREFGDRRGPLLGLGVDCAEGGDNTTWAIASSYGIHHLESRKTPDTVVITGHTLHLARLYGVGFKHIYFDRGGGGKEHADRLRYQGYPVVDVGFGDSVVPDPVRHMQTLERKIDDRHERTVYKNRRAQLYWLLHLRLTPGTDENPYPFNDGHGYGIPDKYVELRRQLAVMQKIYDEEGRIVMQLKRKKPFSANANKHLQSLEEILGCSPDEADAAVLANYAIEPVSKPKTIRSVL